MENSIPNALKNLIQNQATSEEVMLLQEALSSGKIFIGGNVRSSIIIVGSGNTVKLSTEALDRLTAANNRSALHQLPQPPADFAGRKDELKTILDSVLDRKGAFISGITGMAGIGKTVLGLFAANELVTQYSDAQFFIDLRGTSKKPLKPFDVMKHIVQSFYPTVDLKNISESELAGQYQSALSNNKTVLFFDNARSDKQITPLLPPNSCCVFVTSRWQFAVPGLQTLRLDMLGVQDAICLLMGLCPRLSQYEAKQIASLCGYLPIALRVAGSFLKVNLDWTPAEYLALLSKKNELLSNLPDIKTIFSLSYQHLSKQEKQYWRMLAVFPVSFKRDALLSVWELDDENAHKLASKFCSWSLLEYDTNTLRYRVHDLLLEFANSKFTKLEKEKSLLNYFRHYRDVWFAAEELYSKGGGNIVSGLSLFDAESVHIETSQQWAEENATTNPSLWPTLKELPKSTDVIHIRLHPERQITQFGAALAAAQKLGDQYNQNKALGNIGNAYDDLGEHHKAIEYYDQALEIARKIGARGTEGDWLGGKGAACTNLGEYHNAMNFYEQALEIAREIGDRQPQVSWLGNIGATYNDLGENNQAIEYYEQALEIAREIGDRRRQGTCLGNIGNIYIYLGEQRKAIEYTEQTLEIACEMGDRQRQKICLGNIGVAYNNLGENHKGIEYLEQALGIGQEMGDRQQQGFCLGNIGEAYNNMGEFRKAIEYYEQALDIARKIGARGQQGDWFGGIGGVYINLGEYSRAIGNLTQALDIARENGDQWGECEYLIHFGQLHTKMQEIEKAKECLENAMAISRKLSFREQEAKCLFGFAKLSQLENSKETALQYAQEACSIFEAIESPKLTEVTQLIASLNKTL